VTLANNGGTITQTVQFIDAVLRLEIEPQIIDREYMRLKVIVKKDEPDPIKNVQGNPYIIKKDTETTLIVRTGQTVVLSGLTRTRNAVTDRGYPGFKDIPGIGWLGKTENKDDSLEEVLIFLTPQILPEPPLAAALRPAAAPVPAPVPAPALPEAALPATEEGRGQ
jgi:type IV pilus assembly protein PilQ